jgi:hypothetical protein
MRPLSIIGTATLVLLLAGGGDAEAARFCAYYRGGGTNCGFHTFEQCLAAISGVGGSCSENPSYGYRHERPSRRYWR